jgi:hypothetical protein
MNGRFDSLTVGTKAWSSAAMLAACALVLALAGPFGQADRFLPSHRIGLWLLYLVIALPVLSLVLIGLRPRLPRPIVLAAASAVLASLPILIGVETIGLIEGRPLPETALDWLRSAVEVAVLAVPFSVLLERFLRPANVAVAARAIHIANDAYAVCAEGHYTRVFTPRGEQFLDHSFSAVLDALADRDGRQVHRSWWVARDAVEGLQRKGSSAVLEITGGVTVPIARRRLRELKGHGWLN